MHYVIIGNGVAGINAANAIRNRDDSAKISIISSEHDHFFSRTALMYFACGQLSARDLEPYERNYYDVMKFDRIRDHITSINTSTKTIRLRKSGSATYDRLLIACGSRSLMVNWPGIDLDGVGNFVTWQEMEWFNDKVKTARQAVVVGGGLIGIEVAEVLRTLGIDVTFLIREDYFWPIALDNREATIIGEHMTDHGVEVRLKTLTEEVVGQDGKVVGLKTDAGDTIDCDLAVFTIGVGPNTKFLKESDIELDERGGIVVDDYLATSVSDVWAAGDCTSVVWFNDVRRPEQLWYTSRDQGLIAGQNITGDKTVYKRATFYNSAKFFDIEYTTAGLVNFNLEGERNWFQREPGTNYTVRITCYPDDRVAGFNMLGRRWDHRTLVKWIEQKRHLDWVLDHLHQASFDEELMPRFRLVSGEVG